MGTPIADTWEGADEHVDLRVVLIDDGTGNTPFWVRNLGDKPPYGKDPGGVPPLGDETYHGELALPTYEEINEGGRSRGTGDLHSQDAEHGRPLHCH